MAKKVNINGHLINTDSRQYEQDYKNLAQEINGELYRTLPEVKITPRNNLNMAAAVNRGQLRAAENIVSGLNTAVAFSPMAPFAAGVNLYNSFTNELHGNYGKPGTAIGTAAVEMLPFGLKNASKLKYIKNAFTSENLSKAFFKTLATIDKTSDAYHATNIGKKSSKAVKTISDSYDALPTKVKQGLVLADGALTGLTADQFITDPSIEGGFELALTAAPFLATVKSSLPWLGQRLKESVTPLKSAENARDRALNNYNTYLQKWKDSAKSLSNSTYLDGTPVTNADGTAIMLTRDGKLKSMIELSGKRKRAPTINEMPRSLGAHVSQTIKYLDDKTPAQAYNKVLGKDFFDEFDNFKGMETLYPFLGDLGKYITLFLDNKGNPVHSTTTYSLQDYFNNVPVNQNSTMASKIKLDPLYLLDLENNHKKVILSLNEIGITNLPQLFGSASSVLEAGFPRYTHDLDYMVTMEDFNKIKQKWGQYITNQRASGAEFRIPGLEHPIDFNTMSDNGSTIGGRLAWLRARLNNGKKYMEEFSEAVNNSNINKDTPITKLSEKELLGENGTINSIMDAFETDHTLPNKEKHRLRKYNHMEYDDIDLVTEALQRSAKALAGDNVRLAPDFTDQFNDFENNIKILERIEYPSNRLAIASDPKRMQLALNDYYLDKTVLSRGISDKTNNLNSETLYKAATTYDPELAIGGNYMGAGLNTVSLGNSGHGPYYVHFLKNPNISETNVNKFLDQVEHLTTNRAYTPTELGKVQQVYKKYKLDKNPVDLEQTFLDLNSLSKLDAAKALQELHEITGMRSVQYTKDYYNGSNYTGHLDNNLNNNDSYLLGHTDTGFGIPSSNFSRRRDAMGANPVQLFEYQRGAHNGNERQKRLEKLYLLTYENQDELQERSNKFQRLLDNNPFTPKEIDINDIEAIINNFEAYKVDSDAAYAANRALYDTRSTKDFLALANSDVDATRNTVQQRLSDVVDEIKFLKVALKLLNELSLVDLLNKATNATPEHLKENHNKSTRLKEEFYNLLEKHLSRTSNKSDYKEYVRNRKNKK